MMNEIYNKYEIMDDVNQTFLIAMPKLLGVFEELQLRKKVPEEVNIQTTYWI